MKNLPLNFKILFIFFIPAIALTYVSFYFVTSKYNKLDESSMLRLSALITKDISYLVHNIQIERGLSAGYIVATKKENYKDKLLSQYKKTDKAYKSFLHFVKLKSHEKDLIIETIGDKNRPLIKEVINQFSNIHIIRNNVLNSSISFDGEINYYTQINKNLISAMKSFVFILKKQNNDNCALSKLQQLKENAGLERAYIYHQLLSNKHNNDYLLKIKRFQQNQKYLQEKFILNASINSTLVYTSIIDKNLENQFDIYREKFLNNSLSSSDAIAWFEVSSKRIDFFENITSKILNNYIKVANQIYSDATTSLNLTSILFILALISLLFLARTLKNLIKKEEQNMEQLRISSYTFDSHEAMTITDVNGTILKINDAFSRITGYIPSEVIGKNPRVLKSSKHTDEFYKEMWHQLHTKGKWSDDIYNKRKNGEIYLERLSITAIKDENNITTHYIAQFLDISDLKKAQEEAQHQADHDFLTGLINRKALMQRLNEEFIKAKRHDFLHAFLFIDLDEFKAVNDKYGHGIGDQLLIEVAERLSSHVREEDILSRMSGDEFGIIILNIDKNEKEAAKDVREICKKIIKELNKPFILEEYKVTISASIGIKLFPDGEKKVNDVIIHADTAMYQAKNQGKNQFVYFDKSIELELKNFQLLEEELNHAYLNDEFKFYFQPKVDVMSGKIVGAEALVRWIHPQKGIIYPNSFLKVVSEIGMIPKITLLALESASKFIKENEDIFKGTISININSDELLNPLFENNIISTIKRYNIKPSKIELEITENELIKDFKTSIVKIKKLKSFGIKFSIDDFGTGYSSISYLKELPVDSLKIDRSFLKNISYKSNQEIIKMIINMAKTFNITSIVEGIEDESQLNFIQENYANQYQGFLFSKAIDEESFIKLLKA